MSTLDLDLDMYCIVNFHKKLLFLKKSDINSTVDAMANFASHTLFIFEYNSMDHIRNFKMY